MLPDLPPEVWDKIISELAALFDTDWERKTGYVSGQRELAKLMAVSKTQSGPTRTSGGLRHGLPGMNNLTAPHLYKRVQIVDLEHFLRGSRSAAMIPGIPSKRELCELVQVINFEYPNDRYPLAKRLREIVSTNISDFAGLTIPADAIRNQAHQALLRAVENHAAPECKVLPNLRTLAIAAGSTLKGHQPPLAYPHRALDLIAPENICYRPYNFSPPARLWCPTTVMFPVKHEYTMHSALPIPGSASRLTRQMVVHFDWDFEYGPQFLPPVLSGGRTVFCVVGPADSDQLPALDNGSGNDDGNDDDDDQNVDIEETPPQWGDSPFLDNITFLLSGAFARYAEFDIEVLIRKPEACSTDAVLSAQYTNMPRRLEGIVLILRNTYSSDRAGKSLHEGGMICRIVDAFEQCEGCLRR